MPSILTFINNIHGVSKTPELGSIPSAPVIIHKVSNPSAFVDLGLFCWCKTFSNNCPFKSVLVLQVSNNCGKIVVQNMEKIKKVFVPHLWLTNPDGCEYNEL